MHIVRSTSLWVSQYVLAACLLFVVLITYLFAFRSYLYVYVCVLRWVRRAIPAFLVWGCTSERTDRNERVSSNKPNQTNRGIVCFPDLNIKLDNLPIATIGLARPTEFVSLTACI